MDTAERASEEVNGYPWLVNDVDVCDGDGHKREGNDSVLRYQSHCTRSMSSTTDPENVSAPSDRDFHIGGLEDESSPLVLNKTEIQCIASERLHHGRCTEVEWMTRGTYHDIYILRFEDSWECIGRFSRDQDNRTHERSLSEIATMDYVRDHTEIPVPEVFYADTDAKHKVGAAFVFMEKMDGQDLCEIWADLDLEDKKFVMAQVADVVTQLATLHFKAIGCLRSAAPDIGPLLPEHHDNYKNWSHPFGNAKDYLLSSRPHAKDCTEAMLEVNDQIAARVLGLLDAASDKPSFKPPFRLIHGDFDMQNMLFVYNPGMGPPRLSAIIDWEGSYVGMLDELFEYPVFIRDSTHDSWQEDKLLRKHFVESLAEKLPSCSEEARHVREIFRAKSFFIRSTKTIWTARRRKFVGSVQTRSDEDLKEDEEEQINEAAVCMAWARLDLLDAGLLPAYKGQHDD